MRTALIDADVLVYEAARGNEVEIQWDDDLWTLHSHMGDTRSHFDGMVEEIKTKLGASRVVLALSDYTDPWRKRVMPTYKSNRKDVRKPVVFKPLRQYVHDTYETFQRPGLEGDDILGILLTHPKIIPGEKIVVSIDKDMKTLPGLHLNLSHARRDNSWEPFAVSETEADRTHLMQALTGDTVDGYPGCPKIGPVTAKKILDAVLDGATPWANPSALLTMYWSAIVETYAKAGLSEEVALQNARVARICRHTDYDFTKRGVILWTPS